MPTVINEKHHVRRKSSNLQKCDDCFNFIKVGQVYYITALKDGCDFYTWISHKACKEVGDKVYAADEWYYVNEGGRPPLYYLPLDELEESLAKQVKEVLQEMYEHERS